MQDAKELEQYVKDNKSGNRQAQNAAKAKRLEGIYERVEALGYEKSE